MLRKVAQDIPTDYPGLKELIQNMFETNTASDGVGLANSPQIGKSIRVVIIDLTPLQTTYLSIKISAMRISTLTFWSWMTRRLRYLRRVACLFRASMRT